ncbi:short-chain alcohol dehydrogenase [Neonectria magnoliae]|uniref:Short-chain alcohol dehydrogenase n=1 Tax=Neonectria magnoliae TaxID=2732573 RepID=A0ABR1IER2_9HYPO
MNALRQIIPPKPHFTETDVPDLSGRVLYGKNATVWIASRSEEKGRAAITAIQLQHPESKGALKFLKLDLADLTTIPSSANEFLAAEERLDILFNNAGVMTPPEGSKTKQGYELQLGTNCVGPFLFTKLLTPLLQSTAKSAPKGSVRVVWVSSSAADSLSPRQGYEPDNLDYQKPRSIYFKYGVSKAGNYYHATEFARKYKQNGIISIPLNPGNLHSELDRTSAWWFYGARLFTCYPPINGAYTELFAGLSPDITIEKTGTWGSLTEAEGGTGMAEKFWAWSEDQIKSFI